MIAIPAVAGDIVLDMKCPAESSVLPLIRRIIVALAEDMGFSVEDASKIEICVDEACANVIQHAYGPGLGGGGQTLHLTARRSSQGIKITISDRGTGFDLESSRRVRDIDEYTSRPEPRGLGGYIMDEFMDEVVYRFPEQNGTQVTLVKNL